MAGKTGLKAKWRHLADLPHSGGRSSPDNHKKRMSGQEERQREGVLQRSCLAEQSAAVGAATWGAILQQQ